MEGRAVLIMVSAGARDDAERLGEGLVTARLAAWCSVVPTVHSIYFWDGQLQREHEALLLVKTLESRAQAVEDYVRAHHDHPNPEILQVAIERGSSAHLSWLEEQVAKPGG
jgi:periplasmic divalent cation tolerance protein